MRQHAVVGGGAVGMRAGDAGDAAIEEVGEALFFAGGFGVEVDEDGVGALLEFAGCDLGVDGAEGAVEFGHEDAAERIDDEHVGAVAGFVEAGATSGRALGEVERADELRLALDEDEGVLLIEGVIAERDAVGARVEQFFGDGFGDAEPAGGVLAVHDDEIERVRRAQFRQGFDHGFTARAADNVT